MIKCISCGSTDSFVPLKKDGYDLLSCSDCNLIFLHPKPSFEELASNFYSTKAGYHTNLQDNLHKVKTYKSKFVKIAETLSRLKIQGNILDVGCSNGEFLFLATQKGFKGYGVEINKDTADIAKKHGFTVFNGTLQDAKFQDNFFSAVYVGDTLEHVLDPIELIQECHRILKKGGVLVISTPNRDCFFANATYLLYAWFGFPWSVLVPPYHVHIFSVSNLEKILHTVGFKKIEEDYGSPSLRHELGSTGLMRNFRNKKSLSNAFYMGLVFASYTVLYGVNLISKVFLRKDYRMVIFSEKI